MDATLAQENVIINFETSDLVPSLKRLARQMGGARYKKFERLETQMNKILARVHELINPVFIYSLHKTQSQNDDGNIVLENGTEFILPEMEQESDTAYLAACAMTIGFDLEEQCRELNKENEFIDAMILDAAGSSTLETMAEKSFKKIQVLADDMNLYAGCRFGPGYQDMPMSMQQHLFDLVETGPLNLSLGSNMIMKPLKSLSYFVKFSQTSSANTNISKCSRCSMKSCIFRVGQA